VTRTLPTIALLALAGALAIAGCGSSSNDSSSSGGAYGSGGSTGSETTASTASNEGAGAATFVSVGSAADVGQVLVDSKGMTLYYFQKDKKGSGKSACSGACASAWPPLTTEGMPQPSNGSSASKLGTIKRSDGTTQVTYAGWPLYTFVEDKKPGEDNGTDSKAFGASWYPLHPNGEKAGH
jgi:predicted lipoprotein with Yx(FWY)xxD motif